MSFGNAMMSMAKRMAAQINPPKVAGDAAAAAPASRATGPSSGMFKGVSKAANAVREPVNADDPEYAAKRLAGGKEGLRRTANVLFG